MTDQTIADTAFERMWLDARTRVLTERAAQADESARRLRERAPRFPSHSAEMVADAEVCEVYAAECRAAVADPRLPAPSGPNYPSREADRAV